MFIILEGIDGSGKSTLSKMVYDWLTQEGVDSILTRLPGGTPIGKDIRSIVLNADLDPYASVHLFAADRRQHRIEVLEPALKAGKVVICDRYWYSDYAYNVYPSKDKELESFFKDLIEKEELPIPDLIVWLDPPIEVALSRVKEINRNEKKGVEFYKDVWAGYDELFDSLQEVYTNPIYRFTLSSRDTLDKVCKDLKQLIMDSND